MRQRKLRLEERGVTKEIVEIRRLPGKLKVFGAWYLWQSLHQIGWDLLIASFFAVRHFSHQDVMIIKSILGVISAAIQMHFAMKNKARQRWQEKYS